VEKHGFWGYVPVLISIKSEQNACTYVIDVGMQYYTHIARFTTVTLRTLTEMQ
jgi:hypothetical protein